MPDYSGVLSPLRYPGGKRKIANFVKLIFKENHLMDAQYAEPYAGGASVALSLLFSEYASAIHINDKSRSIYAFWHSVLNRTEDLIDRIQSTDVTIDEWERQRAIQVSKESADLLDLGFSTFYLNRTNRSGIISAGVIGGRSQTSKWKLDVRFIKSSLVDRIRRIGRYRRRISIYNADATDFVKFAFLPIKEPKFLNLDPPYYEKGQCLYDNFYEHGDHVQIARLVKSLKCKWMVTYDNVPSITDLYGSFRQKTYGLSYTAGPKHRGTEIMIFSKGLLIPETSTISNLPSKVLETVSF